MQPQKLTIAKSFWLLLVALGALFIIVGNSCADKDKKQIEAEMPVAKISGMDVTCVELPRTAIVTEWANPGLLSKISYVDFFTSYDWLTGSFSVKAQAYDAGNNRVGNPISLSPGSNCSSKLPSLGIGENIINMSDLGIVDLQGQLINFEKILLNPRKFVPIDPSIFGDYLQYEVNVITSQGPGPDKVTLPCPPCQYCKPPNCDTTIIEAPVALPDTTKSGDK
jgi:hypothetical protein